MPNNGEIVYLGIGLALTVLTSVGSLTWWLSTQFNKVREHVYTIRDNLVARMDKIEDSLLDKLEYHERHDDTRFNNIQEQMWELRLKNAAVKGLVQE